MEIFFNIVRGMAVGVANIIPGVSGGTMALLLGIYQRLLSAISGIDLKFARSVMTAPRTIPAEFKRIDGGFLVCLGCGAGVAIIASAKIMTYLLENHHDPTYGFFFGLVLASMGLPYQMIRKIDVKGIVFFALATVLVIGLTMAMTGPERLEIEQKKALLKAKTTTSATADVSRVTEDAKTLLFFAFSGSIAISAMILPGISGSFMMLLLGIYFDLLVCINQRQLLPLVFFSFGCLAGLAIFSRLLKFLLKKYHDQTMSFLLGLVAGSLFAIWPFKNFGHAGNKRIDMGNVFPSEFSSNELNTLLAAITGFFLVVAFIFIEKKLGKKSDV